MEQQAKWHNYHIKKNIQCYALGKIIHMQGGLLVDLTTNTHHEIHKTQMSVLVRPGRYYVWAWIWNKCALLLHSISLTKWYKFLLTKALHFLHEIRRLFLCGICFAGGKQPWAPAWSRCSKCAGHWEPHSCSRTSGRTQAVRDVSSQNKHEA